MSMHHAYDKSWKTMGDISNDIPNIWTKMFETTNRDMLGLDNAIILINSTLKYLDWRFPKQKQYPLVI